MGVTMIFWQEDYEGPAEGGLFFRAYDMVQSIKDVQSTGRKVVGFRFHDNNVEILTEKLNSEEGSKEGS